MTTLTPNATPAVALASWRDSIKITRTNIFSTLFLLLGLVLLAFIPQRVGADVLTTLTLGSDLPNIVLQTVATTQIIAALFIVGGLLGLVPERFLPFRVLRWLRTGLLIFNGLLIIVEIFVLAAAGGSTNILQAMESSLRLATPIAIGALAGLWCERSGVTNVAIEGMMLTGACIGFVAAVFLAPAMTTRGALFLGIGFATLAGGMMALLHAWLSITFRTDQIVSGTVINILALGLTSFLRRELLASSETARETLPTINIPVLSDIPILGDLFFSGKPIYLSMFVLIFVSHIVLYYTRWGLRTRAVGENPHAADTLGINVYWNRYINVVVGGMIAGFAGAWFSLESSGSFDDGMTGGLGFIALAALIFGKWTPFGAAAGALLFGFSQMLYQRFQILNEGLVNVLGVQIPPQIIQMVPYVVTMVVLAGLVGKAVAPKADGVPYKKE